MNRDRIIRNIMIGFSILFLFVMLILPLFSIIFHSLQKGIKFYVDAISDRYVLSAVALSVKVSVIAVALNSIYGLIASWTISKYKFCGKKIMSTIIEIPLAVSPVIAGLAFIMIFGRMGWAYPIIEYFNELTGWNVKIVFAEPGVVLATVFVTIPLVFREIINVLNSRDNSEEEAAALLGAGMLKIFKTITFPHIKWSFLYGSILCLARAMGEFGAVNALSKNRGKTFTLPLEIDALYMSGTSESITATYAVSSLLVIFAIVILIIRNMLEIKERK